MKVSEWLDHHGSSLGICVGQSKYPPTLPNPFLSSPTVTFSLPASSWNQAFGLSHDIILIILILICFPKAFRCNESGENVKKKFTQILPTSYIPSFFFEFSHISKAETWCLSAMAIPPSPHSTWPAAHRGGENVQRPVVTIHEAAAPHVVAEHTYLYLYMLIYIHIIYIYCLNLLPAYTLLTTNETIAAASKKKTADPPDQKGKCWHTCLRTNSSNIFQLRFFSTWARV